MRAVSSELQQYMTGLTNEISRGHFDEAVRLGEKALAMKERSMRILELRRYASGRPRHHMLVYLH